MRRDRVAREKAKALAEQLRSMKLEEAAKKAVDDIEETLIYCDSHSECWPRIRTNNYLERLNRKSRRCTRVVGSFPGGSLLSLHVGMCPAAPCGRYPGGNKEYKKVVSTVLRKLVCRLLDE